MILFFGTWNGSSGERGEIVRFAIVEARTGFRLEVEVEDGVVELREGIKVEEVVVEVEVVECLIGCLNLFARISFVDSFVFVDKLLRVDVIVRFGDNSSKSRWESQLLLLNH